MASKVKGDLRKNLLHKFTHNPVQLAQQGQTGRKVSVMMDAVDEVDSYFSSYMPQVIQATSSNYGTDCYFYPTLAKAHYYDHCTLYPCVHDGDWFQDEG